MWYAIRYCQRSSIVFVLTLIAAVIVSCSDAGAEGTGARLAAETVVKAAGSADAEKQLLRLAESGDEWAAYFLGFLHTYGDTSPRTYPSNRSWLGEKLGQMIEFATMEGRPDWCPVKAAEQFKLAQQVAQDESFDADLIVGVHWLQASAAKGNGQAMRELGAYYSRGEGSRQRPDKAVDWWRKGMEAGNDDARVDYARWLFFGWGGLSADPVEAERLLRKAADRRFARALNALTLMADSDDEKFALWSEAAAFGYVQGQFAVGRCLLLGRGTEVDVDRGLSLLKEASDRGYGTAAWLLGQAYLNGWGVELDTAKALIWYERAWELGDVDSAVRIGWYYLKGRDPVKQDYDKALEWFSRACDLGYAGGFQAIGEYWERLGHLPMAYACNHIAWTDLTWQYEEGYADYKKGANAAIGRLVQQANANASGDESYGGQQYMRCTLCWGTGNLGSGPTASGTAGSRNQCTLCGGSGQIRK